MDSKLNIPDFSLLPLHIITHILGYLEIKDFKAANSLCKSWYYASLDTKVDKMLTICPAENNFLEIFQTNRKLKLKLKSLKFNQVDGYYFKWFEKIGSYIQELHLIECNIKLHHFLKLLEHTSGLKHISYSLCSELEQLSGLFPTNYNDEAKSRIIKNLSGIKTIQLIQFINIPFPDLIRHAINLETFEILNFYDFSGTIGYSTLFKIFDNYNAHNLKHLNWQLVSKVPVDAFLMNFVKIKNLNLKSFTLGLQWYWTNENYKSSLFHQFILKLQTLQKFSINRLKYDQLSFVCKHLLSLTCFSCQLDNDQPISELGKLKQLKELRCRLIQENHIHVKKQHIGEIDKFFRYKFQHLQILEFEEFVTESNLKQLCENHPNLIELHLTSLLTRNLEMIFKYLTKLRKLKIYFGVHPEIEMDPDVREMVKKLSSSDSNKDYEYKISRLQNLEYLYLHELVHGIREDDIKYLKKLESTNLPELFRRQKG